MLPQIRIIIWLVLICVGAVAGFSVGRYALPKCVQPPTEGTTADKITEYESIRDPVTGKIVKKVKRILDKPTIETREKLFVAPNWKGGLFVDPVQYDRRMGLTLEYKLFSNVFDTNANLYLTTGLTFDRDDDTLWPMVGISLSF